MIPLTFNVSSVPTPNVSGLENALPCEKALNFAARITISSRHPLIARVALCVQKNRQATFNAPTNLSSHRSNRMREMLCTDFLSDCNRGAVQNIPTSMHGAAQRTQGIHPKIRNKLYGENYRWWILLSKTVVMTILLLIDGLPFTVITIQLKKKKVESRSYFSRTLLSDLSRSTFSLKLNAAHRCYHSF